MSPAIDRLDLLKMEVVTDLFVDTADDNYVVARLCFAEHLDLDFYWLAAQTLEKYLKASLLLNGRSAKERVASGHDISKLYEQVASLGRDLLPENLRRPTTINSNIWHDETARAFMTRLARDGSPHNRYQVYGYIRHPDDLLKFDAMVFAIRRCCVPLDDLHFRISVPNSPSWTWRQVLIESPLEWSFSSSGKIEKIAQGDRGTLLREALLNLNFCFAPPDYKHRNISALYSGRDSVLFREIIQPLESDTTEEHKGVSRDLGNWVLNNIQLPQDVRDQLRTLCKG